MTCTLWRVAEPNVQRLVRSRPDEIEEFLFGERITPPAPQGGGVLGWLKRLSPIRVETVDDYPQPSGKGTQAQGELDLEKAWHGLHFLFTGTAWEGTEPGCFLLKGGEDLGEEGIGDSVPRLLQPSLVQQFSTFLMRLTEEELTARYDPVRMTKLEIYPEMSDRETGLEHLLDAFDEVRAFVRTAATEGDAIVILVS
jgi:hypothetical protein